MTDKEFLDLLQAEVKRLTDLNRCHQQEILMLQRQLEEIKRDVPCDPPARRRPRGF